MLPKQKIINSVKIAYHYVLQLRDVRFAGQVLFIILVLLVSWSGVKSIDSNYTLQKQITQVQEQNDLQQLENTNLALQNDYYKSDQYLELSARQNFGLGAPGETELVVPKAVALSYTVAQPEVHPLQSHSEASPLQRNVQSWVDFFLHRQP